MGIVLSLGLSACAQAPAAEAQAPGVEPKAGRSSASDDGAAHRSRAPDDSVTITGPATQTPGDGRGKRIDWEFVGIHYATGVGASLIVLPTTYLLVGAVGSAGNGLGPVIGALLIGAFLPPLATYTIQWGVGRTVSKGRDRYYPGFLANLVGHLGVYAGAVAGGADFQNIGHWSAIVFSDAFGVTALGTMMAELTANRTPPGATGGEERVLRFSRLMGQQRQEFVMPVFQLAF